ncbi:MAG TPA: hypothetical protein VGF99_14290 [Myxococcota bacterium]
MTLSHFERHGSFAIGDIDAVFFLEIDGALSPADIDAMAPMADTLRETFAKNCTITMIHRVPMPDGPTRERAAWLSNRNVAGTTSIVVFMDTGFWATAARSVLTGIYMLSGRQQEHRVCATLDEAIVAAAAAVQMPVERLRVAVDAFRARAAHRLPAPASTPSTEPH